MTAQPQTAQLQAAQPQTAEPQAIRPIDDGPGLPEQTQDIRLVVSDMDGTLLDADGEIPAGFWPLLERMHERGIAFVPASGRQLATLEHLFSRVEGLSFVADNGSIVTHAGEVVSTAFVEADAARELVRRVRQAGDGLGLVVSGPDGASIERRDAAFVAEAGKYHESMREVDDLEACVEDALKLAIYSFEEAAVSADRWFREVPHGHRLVVSSHHWIDVMRDGVDKRLGVEALQRELGITRAQTVVFGDYLNDLGMLQAADRSYAMANAHPQVLAAASHRAPANHEHGVLTVLERLLG